ncbi:hypothetical protein LJC30_06975, partial [Odoribacter sp. OttesenSCG-928-L07]|nr:hypothetical protein [Odoribacter sp. OttesenSCG-928-L07]
SLFQESLFMYYVLIFCFILIQYDLKTIFKKDNILKFTKEITPFILLGVAYVIVYFWFGSKHPSQHAGNQFVSAISISQMFGTFVQILKSSSPLYSFLSSKFDLIQMSSRVTADNSFWFYLKDASLMSYIKACLIVLLFLFSIKLLPQEMSRGKLYKLLLISILVVILPILPQLFSVKVYQSQFPIKITSYFSFIGIVLFWATLLYIANLYLLKKPVVYKLFCGLVSLVLFFAALLTQYTNEKVAEDINIAQDKFLIINDFKDTANLRDGDILYAESLLYTKNKSGSIMFNKNILFFNQAMNNFFDHRVVSFKDYESLYNKYCQSEDTINLLFYAQASKSHDTYIALVKCAGKDLTKHVADIKNDNIIVGYRSTYKDFSVNIASDNVQSLSVNNKKLKSFGNMHVLNVSYLPSKSVSSFSIVGENIWPASLSISNITNPYANTIKIGKYDKWIEKIYVEQIKATILNDKQWTQAIQEKAEKRNVPFEQMLNDDALWYIYK